MNSNPQPTQAAVDESGTPPPAEAGQARAKKPPAEPVTTLAGYFERKRYRPARFLADLKAANVWRFSDEDIAAALDMSRDADRHFARTVSLAAAALQADDDRFRRPLVEFVWQSAERRLRENARYVGSVSESGDAEARMHAVGRAIAPRLQEAARRVENLNLLMAAALWLHHTQALSLEVIADEVVGAVGSIPRLRRRPPAALAGYLADQTKAGTKALLPLVGLLEPWIDTSKQAARRADSEQERADAATEAHAQTRAELERAEAEVLSVTAALAQARAEAAEAQKELQAAKIHYEHGTGRLRAQVAATLTGRLAELLTTALEALELQEPRVHVAQEKLEIASEELERQATWLKSSD